MTYNDSPNILGLGDIDLNLWSTANDYDENEGTSTQFVVIIAEKLLIFQIHLTSLSWKVRQRHDDVVDVT